MPSFRDHQPVVIDQFNGLWQRGDTDNTPLDHFQNCNNVKFVGTNAFATRDGIGISQDIGVPPLEDVKRIYNYPTPTGNTLIVLATGVRLIPNYISNSLTPYPFEIKNDDVEPMDEVFTMGTVAQDLQFFDTVVADDAPDSFIRNNGVDLRPIKAAQSFEGYEGFSYKIDIGIEVGDSSEDDTSSESFFISHVTTKRGPDVPAATGQIFHVINRDVVYGPLLSIDGMTDFAFVPFAGRAYISPFTSYPDQNGLNLDKGIKGEFLYVYEGDGTAARKAAGSGMTGTMTVANGAPGHTDPGLHIFGIVSQTRSGYNAPPSILTPFTTLSTNSVSFGNIPTSGDPNVVKRLLVATKVIPTFNGDLTGYQFFFVPGGIINNNTDLFLNNISFYDADLLADASGLLDNYTEIPAGAVLSNYHNRLCLGATYNDISLILVSNPGEPEAINQLDGLIVVPLDGNPVTNIQEMRDVMYVTKKARTVSYTDNGDAPSSWPLIVIDNALGAPVHGIATVLDSGSSSIDFLIITTYQGVSMFNGRYASPELSWKIEAFWRALNRNDFNRIQIINAPIQKEVYIVLPDRRLLVGNYGNGLDYKKIRWSPWTYITGVNTVAVVNIDEIVLGADIP